VRRALLLALALVAAGVAPAAAQPSEDRGAFVPESLWGAKSEVGLGLTGELLTNHGDRSFWQARPSGEDVRVAVVDTGLEPAHPDLDEVLACSHCWRDFVDERPTPYDDNGHGTHVAGILAGGGHLQPNPLQAYFPTGARGVAPGADLIVAKAMNETGGGTDARVAEAVEWALDPDGEPGSGDEPHILHLSLGVRAPTAGEGDVDAGSKTEEAVRQAVEEGAHVVMSAGNDGEEGPANPGNVDGVLAVGGLTADGERLPFSNHGEGVDVYAPGVILSTWPADLDEDGIDDGYTGLAGTSQAAPVVTGALALVLDANPTLRAEEGATKVAHLASEVQDTSRPVETGGRTLPVLDAGALLAANDEGADGVATGVVVALTLLTLVVLLVGGRLGWRALGAWVREHEESEAAGAGGGPATEQEPAAEQKDESPTPGDARFERSSAGQDGGDEPTR
jgi:subtilisin family serine protease